MRAAVLVAIAACGGATPAPDPVAPQDPPPPPPPEPTMQLEGPPVDAGSTGGPRIGGSNAAMFGEHAQDRADHAGPSRTASAGAVSVTGPLDRDVVRRELARHHNDILFCYSKRAAIDPAASGRLLVRMVISPDGSVKTATATGVHPEIEACVVERMKRWRFPELSGGVETVAVSYTLQAP